MIASLRAELLRLRKWPVTWVITGVWLTLNVFFGYLLDYLSYRDAVGAGDQRLADALLAQLSPAQVPSTMVTGLPMFGSALVLILAALATGSGYGWNTWRTVFTQGPGRLSALGGTMLALAVVLVSGSRSASTPTGVRLGAELGVARQTLQRWQAWWIEQFPLTPLWRATCARFMPPVLPEDLPGELLERFTGPAHEAVTRLLVWLSPVTVRSEAPAAIELREGC